MEAPSRRLTPSLHWMGPVPQSDMSPITNAKPSHAPMINKQRREQGSEYRNKQNRKNKRRERKKALQTNRAHKCKPDKRNLCIHEANYAPSFFTKKESSTLRCDYYLPLSASVSRLGSFRAVSAWGRQRRSESPVSDIFFGFALESEVRTSGSNFDSPLR